jgi:type IV pilus assembly protein PilM
VSVLNKQLSMPSLPSFSPRKSSRAARRPATVTGLEISSARAIAAQARLLGGQIVAERAAARALPGGLMRDGLITEPDRLAGEIKSLFSEHKFSKRVRVGLATPRTVLRVIDLPPLEDKDIRTALIMQAQERIPMPLERAVMDFQKVGLVDTPEGQRLRVIVVVTERDGVDLLLYTLRRAGLKPEGIDLSIFSVIRSLNHHIDPGSGPVLYAQLGDLVNIAIAEDGICRFTRQAPQGLSMVLGRLAESRGIPLEQAQDVLNADDDVPGDGEVSVADLLTRTAIELGSELRAAAEFYSTQFGSDIVTSGVVAGPLAPLPGFLEALSVSSGLDLTCGQVVAADADALGDVDARIAPVAAGLAVGALAS